jgi:hypothetical protein
MSLLLPWHFTACSSNGVVGHCASHLFTYTPPALARLCSLDWSVMVTATGHTARTYGVPGVPSRGTGDNNNVVPPAEGRYPVRRRTSSARLPWGERAALNTAAHETCRA